jgi:hypothetical protein
LPVYEATESLSKELSDQTDFLIPENRVKIEAFCKLIDDSVAKITPQAPESPAE